MTPNDDDPEEMKNSRKKYMWFGYGGYGGPGEPGVFNSLNIRADPGILDGLLELFKAKKKTREEPFTEDQK